VNTIPLSSNLKTDVSDSLVIDVVIVLGLLSLARAADSFIPWQ
jgi:hypothetical protein